MKPMNICWKVGAAMALCLLLFLAILSIPRASAVSSEQTKGELSEQESQTVDPTVTALEKEQLALQTEQLQHNLANYLWNNLTVLLSTLILIGGGVIGFWRWRVERKAEIEKRSEERRIESEKRLEEKLIDLERRSEERFQEVIESLGDEKPSRQIAGAIMLRSFLQPRYEPFYQQIFELAVATLQLRHEKERQAKQTSAKPNPTKQLSILDRTLVVVFQEAFPHAREHLGESFKPTMLDASNVYLENANLEKADFKDIFLRRANLRGTNLAGADLRRADLVGADLSGADLTGAKIFQTTFSQANLTGAKMLSVKGLTKQLYKQLQDGGAALDADKDFSRGNLRRVNFRGSNLREADFSGADLSEANFSGAKFVENPDREDFDWASIEEANAEVVLPNPADQ